MRVPPEPVSPRRRHPAAVPLLVGTIPQLQPSPWMPEVYKRDPLDLAHLRHRPTRYRLRCEVREYGALGDNNGRGKSRVSR